MSKYAEYTTQPVPDLRNRMASTVGGGMEQHSATDPGDLLVLMHTLPRVFLHP